MASLFFVRDNETQKNVLASIITKHEMLQKTTSPKIIFAGGSNVSFGLDCKVISDSLKMAAINTAMHGGLGMEFMANNIKPYIHKGDVVVFIPEYENFYSDIFYGEMELVSLLFDVDPLEQKNMDADQWMHLIKYIVPYSAKKIKNQFLELFQKENPTNRIDVYDKNSFNEYGDTYIHWILPAQKFVPMKSPLNKKIKPEAISFIKKFKIFVESRHAKLILFPPVLEESSYAGLKDMIDKIDITLREICDWLFF